MATLFENVNMFSQWILNPDVVDPLKKQFEEHGSKNTTEFGSEKNDVVNADLTINDSLSSYFSTNFSIDTDPLNDINDLIIKYRKISSLAYVNDAIEEICNEAIVLGEGEQVWLSFNDRSEEIQNELKEKIKEEFANILDILDFDDKGNGYFKQWYVDGRLLIQTILHKDIEKRKKHGIEGVKLMSPMFLKRLWDDKNKEYYYIYDDKKLKDSKGNDAVGKIPDELVVFVPSGKYDGERKIPLSFLHNAIKEVQRLDILEDHMLIYRVTRAPERRVFYIDPGNIPPKQVQQYMEKIINNYKQRKFWDENSGTLSSKTKHPSMIEDFFLLRRGDKNTEIQTLQSGGALDSIEDLHYFKRKAAAALRIPFSRMNSDDRKDSKNGFTGNEITREELKFNRFIQTLRSNFNTLFFEMLKKQLVLKEVIKVDEWNSIKRKLVFNYKTDMQFVEAKKLQILESKLAVLRDANEYVGKYFSTKYIKKNILQLTTDEENDIDKEIAEDKALGLSE